MSLLHLTDTEARPPPMTDRKNLILAVALFVLLVVCVFLIQKMEGVL